MPANSNVDGLTNGDGRNGLDNLSKTGPNLREAIYTGDVVISGMSGRLPQSADINHFWENLIGKVDMITEDNSRFEPGLSGSPARFGKIPDIKSFDAEFFGFPPKVADALNPQHRIMAEVCAETIFDAGRTLESLKGTRTGVFVGEGSETDSAVIEEMGDPIFLTGYSRTMLANRISYIFDLNGISYTADTACSSSLTCLDQAIVNMRMGLVDAALVVGANLIMEPWTSSQFLEMGMINKEGICKTFDANADGYVRSEAIVAVFLQKREDAKRIYSVCVHSKSNADGYKSQGPTFPSSAIQKQLMTDVLKEGHINPNDITYMEAHGTGTEVGDPEECKSIAEAICENRKKPLPIGSVKSNMGHAEGSAGLVSVVKVLNIMEHMTIPPNLNFKEPNPEIPSLTDGRLQVVTECTPWEKGLACVNSFGFGGANSHVVLRPHDKELTAPHVASKKMRLFTCAARTDAGVKALLEEARKNAESVEYHALMQELANALPAKMPYRGFTVINASEVIENVQICSPRKHPVIFIFPGAGSQWNGMGKEMMEIEIFRNSIMRSTEILSEFGISIYDMVMNSTPTTYNDVINSYSVITAIQIAFVDLLKALGIRPISVFGHSMGEVACGYCVGALTAKEALLINYWRARCTLEASIPKGKMAVVEMSWDMCLKRCPEGVEPVCNNASDMVTVAGLPDAVDYFVKEVQNLGHYATVIDSMGFPFHSSYMKPAAAPLKKILETIITPRERTPMWMSTSIPHADFNKEYAKYCSADYIVNNLLSPVLFYEACQLYEPQSVFIEVGPHCNLLSMLSRTFGMEPTLIGTNKRNISRNIEYFFTNLGKCYNKGVNLNPLKAYPPVEFPVPRGTPMVSPGMSRIWDHSQEWFVPIETLLNRKDNKGSGGYEYELDLSPDSELHYLMEHKVDTRNLLPASGYYYNIWKTMARMKDQPMEETPVIISDIVIEGGVVLSAEKPVTLKIDIVAATGEFTITESDNLVMRGTVTCPDGPVLESEQYPMMNSVTKPKSAEDIISGESLYRLCSVLGYDYGPSFQRMTKVSNDGTYAEIDWDGRWIVFIDNVTHNLFVYSKGKDFGVPTRIKSIKIDPRLQPKAPENGEPPIPLTFYANKTLRIGVCSGVEIQEIHNTKAINKPKIQEALIQEHRFVPYIQDTTQALLVPNDKKLTERYAIENVRKAPTLEWYARACEELAMESLRKLMTTDSTDALPSKVVLKSLLSKYKQTVNSHKLDPSDSSGLFEAFSQLFANPLSDHFKEKAATLLLPVLSGKTEDALLSGLDNEENLKSCVDIVLDNNLSNVLAVLEGGAANSGLYRKIIPALSAHTQIEINYTAADTKSLDKDAKNLGIKSSSWDLGDSQSTASGENHLFVLKNVLHKQKDIDESLKVVHSMMPNRGFLLVEEVTDHFPLFLMIEALLEELTEEKVSQESNRLLGRYMTEKHWLEAFTRQNFEVIFKRNNALSSLFLLRKKSEITKTPTIIYVDDFECSWLKYVIAEMAELEEASDDTRLWLVARQDITGLLGLMTCLRLETGGLKVRSIFISNLKTSRAPDISPRSAEFQKLVKKDLVYNVYRDGVWGCFKHFPIPENTWPKFKPMEHAYVDSLVYGDLSSLTWMESPLRFEPPKKDMALYSVYYASLNFRDIVVATGRLPPDAIPKSGGVQQCLLGCEFCGRDASGKRVMGIVKSKAIATVVETTPIATWNVPEKWTMEEAATVPLVYSTVYYALFIRGNMKKGETILIHSGSGGVGQAAISVALHHGCQVFTTVGTKEKKEYLQKLFPQLKDKHFSNTRDMSFYYDIQRETNGKGVDIVLNSLAEEKLQASFKLLAPYGRFLEIGKFDMVTNKTVGMSMFLQNVTFHGISLEVPEGKDSYWNDIHSMVQDGINKGVVRPLKTTVFGKDDVEAAFRYMAQGKHIGKILIKIREEEQTKVAVAPTVSVLAKRVTMCDPAKTYIVVGGLGGFGLELAEWLVIKGARKLVLTSRFGVRTPYQRARVLWWTQDGINVEVSKRDVKTLDGAMALIKESSKMGPVGGIFNLAMVLNDGLFEYQTERMFQQCFEPKVQGTINLDKATRELCKDSLDWFIAFSSISCGFGNLGQTNYGYANSVMERICEKRKLDGLPALAIQWGPIGDVGVMVDQNFTNDQSIGGTVPQKIKSCVSVMDHFLIQDYTIISSFVHAHKDIGQSAGGLQRPKLMDTVTRVLNLKDVASLDPTTSLADLGLDSLMGVEIKQILQKQFDISLSNRGIRKLTLQEILKMDGTEDGTAEATTKEAPKTAPKAAPISQRKPKRITRENMEKTSVPSGIDKVGPMPTKAILKINEIKNNQRPLFCLHPLSGYSIAYNDLAGNLKCPVYGLQLTPEAPLGSIQELASFYLKNVMTVDPVGPYKLVAYSYSCAIALEMAIQLCKKHPERPDIVESLVLIEGSHNTTRLINNMTQSYMRYGTDDEMDAILLNGMIYLWADYDTVAFNEQLIGLSREEKIRTCIDLLVKGGHTGDRRLLEHSCYARLQLIDIAQEYKATSYDGDIVLIRAKHGVLSKEPEDMGLREICKGKIDVYYLDKDHVNIIDDDGATETANIFKKLKIANA